MGGMEGDWMLSRSVEEVLSSMHAAALAVQDHAEARGGGREVDRRVHVAVSGASQLTVCGVLLATHSARVYQMDHTAALHRIQVGVPATVEHSSEAGPETAKWVAETTQVRCSFTTISYSFCSRIARTRDQNFITFVDALKLRMRAKDQLHPILQELVTSYARFRGSKDWEGRSKMVGWCASLLSCLCSGQDI